jgi:hypothetical protein
MNSHVASLERREPQLSHHLPNIARAYRR